MKKTHSASQGYNFEKYLQNESLDLKPQSIETMQINLTKLCNQICTHCHVDSSPKRREALSPEAMAACLKILGQHDEIITIDLTGGAPELHDQFKHLVKGVRDLGKKVIVRHNLTVTMDPHPVHGHSLADLPEFFAEHGVEVVSSLPCYTEEMTNRQRGDGVFEKSIQSLQRLNAVGFGTTAGRLRLNLVYNPVGTHLPPDQFQLEADYKRELKKHFDVCFDNLFTVTNMPIHRFKAQLVVQKKYAGYMDLLTKSFNVGAAQGVMCRNMVSISHDGYVYDCDFNQMFDMKIGGSKPLTVFDWDHGAILGRRIRFGDHCFGCTAGAGSSCGGALSS